MGLYRLPFKVIPKVMIRALALRVTRHRNYFPDSTGISKHYSPATILGKRIVDCRKELTHSFGDYVQANFEKNPKNKIALYYNIRRAKVYEYLVTFR